MGDLSDDDKKKLGDYAEGLIARMNSDDPKVKEKAMEEAKLTTPIVDSLSKKSTKKRK